MSEHDPMIDIGKIKLPQPKPRAIESYELGRAGVAIERTAAKQAIDERDARIQALEAELSRVRGELAEALEKLKPRAAKTSDTESSHAVTADGVPLVRGLEVWFFSTPGKRRFESKLVSGRTSECCGHWWTFQVGDENTRWCREPELVYSTEAAAREAALASSKSTADPSDKE